MEGIITSLVSLCMVLVVIAIVFLACREIVCWYAKINERLELEKKRNEHLEKIVQNLNTLIQIEFAKKEEREANDVFDLTEEVPSRPVGANK